MRIFLHFFCLQPSSTDVLGQTSLVNTQSDWSSITLAKIGIRLRILIRRNISSETQCNANFLLFSFIFSFMFIGCTVDVYINKCIYK